MSKTVAWFSIGFVVTIFGFALFWFRSSAESVPFPDGYLLREKPSIFFDGHRDLFTDEFLYDLVIEDIAEFVVVRNWSRSNFPDHPSHKVRYKKLTRAKNRAECLAADLSPELRAISTVWRSNFDLMRGKCVTVQVVEQNYSDLQLREDEDSWSFEVRSTGRQVARAPKAHRRENVRALFGERATISQQAGSPIFEDNFTDVELLRAIESGGYAAAAAITIIRQRARIEDRSLIPAISVRRAISPEVLEALLQLASVGKDPAQGFLPEFQALIPGASKETAGLIYSKMIEMLYAPFKASEPYGPWYYGNSWKEQIGEKRPALQEEFVSNDYLPVFAAAQSFRSASALALHLGQPYIKRFYEEFGTEIMNRTLSNSGPSFHTAILAQSESDLVGIISEIQSQEPSPNRMTTIWALIEQGSNLPQGFIEELRNGCNGDPDFLNNPLASQKYLDGETFCSNYFQTRYRQ